MRKILWLASCFLISNHVVAAQVNSPEQELINYFHTSSLTPVQPQLENCQKNIQKFNQKIDSFGFYKEISLIKNLGSTRLTNDLKVEVVGDNLQLLSREKAQIDLYNKAKQILLKNGLTLISEAVLKNPDGTKTNLSIFKKPQYSLNIIKENEIPLLEEQKLVYKNTWSCVEQVLSSSMIEQLNLNDDHTKIILTNNFYRKYPQLQQSQVIENIFINQTYDAKYFLYREQTLNNLIKPYDNNIKKVLTTIFYHSTTAYKAFVKYNGVEREIGEIYSNLNNWNTLTNNKVQHIMYHSYDAVSAMNQ